LSFRKTCVFGSGLNSWLNGRQCSCVPIVQADHIEHVIAYARCPNSRILQRIEVRAPGFVDNDQLAVHNCAGRQVGKRFRSFNCNSDRSYRTFSAACGTFLGPTIERFLL